MGRKEKLWEKLKERASKEDIPRIEKKLDPMNRGPIKKVWDKVQLLWELIKDPNAAWEAKAAAIGALIYLISPLDAVPDFIPGVGLLDDVAIILFVIKMLADALKKYAINVVTDIAEAETRVIIRRQIILVLVSVLGTIAIAGIVLILKLI